jgi:streptomycin 6-kinase
MLHCRLASLVEKTPCPSCAPWFDVVCCQCHFARIAPKSTMSLLSDVLSDWSLEQAGPPVGSSNASLIVPVRANDGAEFVLKLVPSATELEYEARALHHWQGAGAVRIERVDLVRGALLTERVIPGTPLYALGVADDRAATRAALGVVANLRRTPAHGTYGLPALESWIDPLDAQDAEGTELSTACNRARLVASELLADSGARVVLHGDLHHWNILQSGRAAWLVVDPKGLSGPREAELAALLRNPRHLVLDHPHPEKLIANRVDLIGEYLGDDVQRVLAWAYVLAVVAAYWAWEDNEGATEVARWLACVGIIDRVAKNRGAG